MLIFIINHLIIANMYIQGIQIYLPNNFNNFIQYNLLIYNSTPFIDLIT